MTNYLKEYAKNRAANTKHDWKPCTYSGSGTPVPGISAFIGGNGVFIFTDFQESIVLTGEDKGQKTKYDGWFKYFISGHMSGLCETVEDCKREATEFCFYNGVKDSDSKYRSKDKWFNEGVQLVG